MKRYATIKIKDGNGKPHDVEIEGEYADSHEAGILDFVGLSAKIGDFDITDRLTPEEQSLAEDAIDRVW